MALAGLGPASAVVQLKQRIAELWRRRLSPQMKFTVMQKLSLAIALLALWGLTAESARADLVFTSNMQADFDFEVVDGPLSAIDGITAGDVIPFSAVGPLEFTLDDSVPGATSMAFTNVTGTLTGISPGAFMPFEITPDAQFVGGSLDNIVRTGGVITSADVVDLRMLWEMSGTPAILGGQDVLLYTTDPLAFNGHVTSLPFGFSDVLVGPDDFEVYLDAGLGNPGLPGGDPLAVIGRNRRLTAVPEPGFSALLGIVLSSFISRRKRRS